MSAKKTASKKGSIDQALKDLEEAIAYFESDGFDLETGMQKYELAVDLVKKISAQLKGLELKIDIKKRELEKLADE
jgi:exodeoxyribonuclease VII small subunit